MQGGLLTVLLIEDNPGDARLIKELLREAVYHSFEIVLAESLSCGLALVSEQTFDAILLDLSLPDSLGLDTVIRTREAVTHLPVVVLTGADDAELGIAAVNEGAQDYLAKDEVTSVLLERSLIYAIGRHQAVQQRLALAVEQQRVRMLASFVNDVSHEIRTPLAVIQLNAERLEQFAESNPRAQQRAQQIGEQTLYISSLVDAMLALTELDNSRQLDLSPVDVNHVVRTAAGAIRPTADEKSLTVHLELACGLPDVNAHPNHLHAALVHLLDNAVRFTPEGGVIRVVTELAAKKTVGVTVADSGVGIAEADLPLIFERFFRTDQARTGRRAGLGLSIVQRIVDLHQGQLEVRSVVGQGSTFRILLPAESGRAEGHGYDKMRRPWQRPGSLTQ